MPAGEREFEAIVACGKDQAVDGGSPETGVPMQIGDAGMFTLT
jgi:hypothetical protein